MNTDSFDVLSALRGQKTLNLFPTENRMSPRALQALSSDAVHRYPGSEGPGYFYGNTDSLTRVYRECERLACEFFGARQAYVNFLSGLHAMQSVLMSLSRIGDRLLIMDATCGGHYATASICKRLGLSFDVLPFDRRSCLIDLERLRLMVRELPPKLIYLDLSTVLRLPRIAELREVVGPEPLICLDASHLLGVLLAGSEGIGLKAGASTCSGSTHKSFPGPQKGLFLTDREDIAEAMQSNLSFTVSSAHANSVGALAITLEELMPHREQYGKDILANARKLAQSLFNHGFKVNGSEFGFSETHQVWISPPDNVSPLDWGRRLLNAGIRITVVTLPSTGRPGLRMGVQELTRVGMGPDEMELVAQIFSRCLLTAEQPDDLRPDVEALAEEFSQVQYLI